MDRLGLSPLLRDLLHDHLKVSAVAECGKEHHTQCLDFDVLTSIKNPSILAIFKKRLFVLAQENDGNFGAVVSAFVASTTGADAELIVELCKTAASLEQKRALVEGPFRNLIFFCGGPDPSVFLKTLADAAELHILETPAEVPDPASEPSWLTKALSKRYHNVLGVPVRTLTLVSAVFGGITGTAYAVATHDLITSIHIANVTAAGTRSAHRFLRGRPLPFDEKKSSLFKKVSEPETSKTKGEAETKKDSAEETDDDDE